MTKKDYNEQLVKVYDQIAVKYHIIRETMPLTPEIDDFCSKLPPNALVLDAGCGNGRDSEIMANMGYKVTGVDCSEGQLEIAKTRKCDIGSLTFLKKDLRQLDLPERSIDGIWCCAVLQHFNNADIERVLCNFNTVLNIGGVLVATFKRGKGDRYVIEEEFDDIQRYTNFHQITEIEIFANHTGFCCDYLTLYNEKERFGQSHRNLDFIVAQMRKIKDFSPCNPIG